MLSTPYEPAATNPPRHTADFHRGDDGRIDFDIEVIRTDSNIDVNGIGDTVTQGLFCLDKTRFG